MTWAKVGVAMSWDLQELGLPNSAVVLALALVPLVAMALNGVETPRVGHVSASLEAETTVAQAPIPDSGVFVVPPVSK